MTAPGQVSLAVVAVALLAGIFWLYDWNDRWQRRGAAIQAIQEQCQKLHELQPFLAQLPQIQQQIQARQAAMNESISTLVGEQQPDTLVPEVVCYLKRLGGNVTAGGTLPRPPEPLEVVYNRGFALSIEGNYATLHDFLVRLGHPKLRRLITINSLRLSQGPVDATGHPRLTLDLPLTAYASPTY